MIVSSGGQNCRQTGPPAGGMGRALGQPSMPAGQGAAKLERTLGA
ncbi:hypothetical protein VB716_06295 [Synechococcus sp. CCY9201]|nr:MULTISPECIES: hypothetical protein [unclassified Synechococcus]MEA5473828.1 hypothetical protein [Synechococcus sp. CCY9201]